MATFQEHAKRLVFLWGAVSLTVILGSILFMMIANLRFGQTSAPLGETNIIHERTVPGK